MTDQTIEAMNDWIMTKPKRDAFFAQINELGESVFGFSSNETKEWAYKVLGVTSMKEYAGSAADAMDQLEAAAGVGETRITDDSGNVSSADWHASENWRESPVVVYPMANGGIVYKGAVFSVTLRFGGTWDMAVYLMDQFVAHKELIAPNCLISKPAPALAQPSEQRRMGQEQSIQQTPAQPAQGGQLTEKIVKVKREFDNKKNVYYTGLYTLYGQTAGQYPTYRVSDTADMTLELLAKITGISWVETQPGTEAACNFTVSYKNSDKTYKNKKGEDVPYHNLESILPI